MPDIEEIRRRKLEELQRQIEAQEQAQLEEELERQQFEIQKRAILRRILTHEARSRLTNIKMVKPEYAEQIELQLIQLAQTGKLRGQITEEQLKKMLLQIEGKRREIRIRRK